MVHLNSSTKTHTKTRTKIPQDTEKTIKTHDLICSTRSIARVFAELSEQKKVTIEEMEFGALRHIPKLKVLHKLLKELILCFDLYHGFLDTRYGKIYITPAKIGDALGLISGRDNFSEKVAYNKLNEQQKEIADCFKGATLAFLTKSVTDMSVEGDENLLKFKMTFILFVQKCFLLSTTTSTVSLVQKPPLLHVETFPDPEADDAPRPPWVGTGHERVWSAGLPSRQIMKQSEKVEETSKKRKQKEKRLKRKNGGAAKTNVALDNRDSMDAQYDLSQALPIVNSFSESEPMLQIQMSLARSVNAPSNNNYQFQTQHQAPVETLKKESKQEVSLNLSFGIPTASPQRNFGKPWHKSTDLEKLVEAVIDAGLTIALQYAEQTSVEPSLSTPEGYKTPVKEKEVVSAMCMVLNDRKCRRLDEEIYCLPTNIVNLMLGKHNHKYIDPNTKASYHISEFKEYLSFLDKRKLTSHPFVISQMRVYVGAKLLVDNEEGLEAPHISISSQRTFYDCEIYVMKWLETIDPKKIKKWKIQMREYGPTIFLDKVNKLRDKVIEASNAIRIPMPSAALSNPFCKFSYEDIESK
ncbi:hypothetical protein Ahy_A01g000983 [Arachis hypogaea]|uniref:Uncharacterized protein n=1 Tax=Arachis hypogaea TaxID=3818 RepID=A0A445ELQ7_ARAHY|nr:hypothetical protein Ahy_A01g000983 [Arachis hypogaea]